jgi:hypothetical protein
MGQLMLKWLQVAAAANVSVLGNLVLNRPANQRIEFSMYTSSLSTGHEVILVGNQAQIKGYGHPRAYPAT